MKSTRTIQREIVRLFDKSRHDDINIRGIDYCTGAIAALRWVIRARRIPVSGRSKVVTCGRKPKSRREL